MTLIVITIGLAVAMAIGQVWRTPPAGRGGWRSSQDDDAKTDQESAS